MVTIIRPMRPMAPLLEPNTDRNRADNARVVKDWSALLLKFLNRQMLVEQRRLGAQVPGEANTASNSGSGAGLSQAKVGVDLPFKSIVAGTAMDAVENTDDVTLNVDERVIDHDNLLNYLVTQHRIINDSGTGSTELWSANKISGSLQPLFSSSDSVVADAGSAQGGSPQTANFIHIGTVATAGDSVTLPNVQVYSFGTIANDGANSADIFPILGEEINGTGVNNAVALAAGARAWISYLTSGQWRMVTL